MKRGLKNVVRLGGALLAAFASALGCGLTSESTDSESHFLAFCGDGCGAGLRCICGLCTKACDAEDACQALSEAARCQPLDVSVCLDSPLACDASCSSDADCSELGQARTCASGRCRASTRPTPPVASDSDADGEPISLDAELILPPEGPDCCPGVSFAWSGYELTTTCEFVRGGQPLPLCQSQLPACDDSRLIDGSELRAAVSHPDVLRAIAEQYSRTGIALPPHPAYGWDGGEANASARSTGASFLSPQLGTAGFTASFWAHDCSERVNGASAPADCEPIPAGIRALAELQETLLMQQLTLGTCAPEPGCYAALAADACEPEARTANYDIEARQCLPALSCSSDGNAFESLLACERACSNDPCALAPSVAPQDCAGLAVPLVATNPPTVRCFENNLQACLCACSASGAPLSACYRQTGAAPVVACDP